MAHAIGNIILELRMQRNMTQKELGDKLNVTAKTVSTYEKGIRQPPLETVAAMADVFNVSTDVLFGRAPIPTAGHSHLDLTGQMFMKYATDQLERAYIEFHPEHVMKTNHKK